MVNEEIFVKAHNFIRSLFDGDGSGHDYYHSVRVHDLAVTIQRSEGGDLLLIRLAALLHDADDRKLFGSEGSRNAKGFMERNGIPEDVQNKVLAIISQISFKGSETVVPDTLEGKIVQDADRLDAIGAIGIARAFAYGGSRSRPMHLPDSKPVMGMDAETYYKNEGSTVNHFYEKLLLLKDLMNTDTAKKIASQRHEFMESFLKEFYAEWDGLR